MIKKTLNLKIVELEGLEGEQGAVSLMPCPCSTPVSIGKNMVIYGALLAAGRWLALNAPTLPKAVWSFEENLQKVQDFFGGRSSVDVVVDTETGLCFDVSNPSNPEQCDCNAGVK